MVCIAIFSCVKANAKRRGWFCMICNSVLVYTLIQTHLLWECIIEDILLHS